MNGEAWATLMATARRQAAEDGQRARVVGVLAGRSGKLRWTYTVECSLSCPCRMPWWKR